ncbi:hypothetical protein LSAT2_015227 [Lamellibrachia satsuma]|nr:hypothetical protein LSAT2_015227 [Lamellibrachia satsuma]
MLADSLGSPSSPPAPQTLYHAPPSQATYAQRSPFPSPPAPWMIYHARPSPSNVHQTPPDDATSWQTRMFYILEKQNSEMAEMKRMLSSLMKKVATSREEPSSLPERIQFPLASEEAVQALEQDLTDKETEKALKHHLAVIGGENLKDVTTRIMKTVFSQQLALKYCWTGNARVKRAFQSLKLREVIFNAVRNNEVSKNGTNHEIKHVIQEWFRTASDRDGGRKRRMNCAQAQQDVAEIK